MPLYIMVDGDIAQTLGAILRDEMGVDSEILVIDGVVLWDFDYIDLGRIRMPRRPCPSPSNPWYSARTRATPRVGRDGRIAAITKFARLNASGGERRPQAVEVEGYNAGTNGELNGHRIALQQQEGPGFRERVTATTNSRTSWRGYARCRGCARARRSNSWTDRRPTAAITSNPTTAYADAAYPPRGIRSGGKSQKHGHVNEAAFYILDGQGYEIHDGVRYDWSAGDVAIVHNNCVHQHFNADPVKPARALVLKTKPMYMFMNMLFQHLVEPRPTEPAPGGRDCSGARVGARPQSREIG